MTYTRAVVERAMKVQEVILRALSGRQSWLQVADVLGVSPRTVRRLRLRYQKLGYSGLFDRRRRCSPRAVPLVFRIQSGVNICHGILREGIHGQPCTSHHGPRRGSA
jgi:winged helix-turn helix protein